MFMSPEANQKRQATKRRQCPICSAWIRNNWYRPHLEKCKRNQRSLAIRSRFHDPEDLIA